MRVLVAGLVLVPVVDQTVKLLLRSRLGSRAVPVGLGASLRVVGAQIWLVRVFRRPSRASMWMLWLLASGPLVALGVLIPSSTPFTGLLLGGSFTHVLESARRGRVSDYICLGSWLRFDLADVAITAGGLGVVAHLPIALRLALS